MNVTAAGRAPAHVARPERRTTEAPATDDTTRTRGGPDTPFTHAIDQGNGKKVGIHRRMPTADEVASEQLAAGLDPTGVPADDLATTAPAPGAVAPQDGAPAPVEDPPVEDPPVGDAPIAIDGSELAVPQDASVVDELAAAAAEASAELAEPIEQVVVPDGDVAV